MIFVFVKEIKSWGNPLFKLQQNYWKYIDYKDLDTEFNKKYSIDETTIQDLLRSKYLGNVLLKGKSKEVKIQLVLLKMKNQKKYYLLISKKFYFSF